MDNKIELNWTLKVNYFVQKGDIFRTLVDLYTIYCDDTSRESNDHAQFMINWLKNNLINYIKDFLALLDSSLDIDYNTDGEIRYENITQLLDNREFMKEFRQYLHD